MTDERETSGTKLFSIQKGKTEILSSMIGDMQEQVMIEPSICPKAAPIVITSKKDGIKRVVVDYRCLKLQTE